MTEVKVGDIVEMKKQHPCGSKNMKILRIGLDYRLECQGCGCIIMTPRRTIAKHIKKVITAAPCETEND